MSPLEDIDLELEQVAATAHRAFHLATDQDPDGEVHPGWYAVARHVVSLVEAGEDDVQLSFTQLGQMLRREFARAAAEDLDDLDALPAWEAIPRKAQLAWVAVARHLMNVMSGEITRQLAQHEGAIADWAKAQLAAA